MRLPEFSFSHSLALISLLFLLGLSVCYQYGITYPLPVIYAFISLAALIEVMVNKQISLPCYGLPSFLFLGALGVFTFLILVNPALSAIPEYSIKGLWGLLALPAGFALALYLLNQRLKLICYTSAFILIMTLIMTGIGAWQFWSNQTYYYEPHGLFINPNIYAVLINMLALVLLAIGWSHPNRLLSYGALTLVIWLFASLILTSAKAAFVIFGFSVLLILALLNADLKERWRRVLFVFAGFALAYILIQGQSSGLLRLESYQSATFSRLPIYEAALKMIVQAPFLGHGIGSFYHLYLPLREEFTTGGHYAHMDVLDFVVEMGVLAAISFYLMMGAAFWLFIRIFFFLSLTKIQRGLALGVFSGSLAAAIQSHVSFPYHIMHILAVQGVYLAILYYMAQQDFKLRDRGFTIHVPKALAISLCALFVIYAAYGTTLDFWQAKYYQKARQAMSEDRIDSALKAVNAASQLSFGTSADAYLEAARIQNHILKSAGLSPSQESRQAQLVHGLLEKSVQANPYIGVPHYYRSLLIKRGYLKETEERGLTYKAELEKSLEKNPFLLPARLALAEYYKKNGNSQARKKLLYEAFPFIHLPADKISRNRYRAALRSLAENEGDQQMIQALNEKLAQFADKKAAESRHQHVVSCFMSICAPWKETPSDSERY